MRLAALSTAGELSTEDHVALEAHLDVCPECREAYADFERLSAEVLPAVGAEAEQAPPDDQDTWSVEDAEERLMGALDKDPSKSGTNKGIPKPIVSIVALVLAGALGGLAAVAGMALHSGPTAKNVGAPQMAATSANLSAPSAVPFRSLDTERSADRDALSHLREDLAKSRSEQLASEVLVAKLTTQLKANADATSQEHDLEEQNLASEQAKVSDLQEQLTAAQAQGATSRLQLASLEASLSSLRTTVEEKDKLITQDHELLQHDRDIRDLMGARNLFITDLIGVSESNKTQKAFARLFYTEDKSLIFYGFDFDQQPGVKTASVFQAWGSSDADHPVSLGVFYRDDKNQHRWVLKFNDAVTLARLDSVFVTAEPKGGSAKPTGKPLLSASLRISPNHP